MSDENREVSPGVGCPGRGFVIPELPPGYTVTHLGCQRCGTMFRPGEAGDELRRHLARLPEPARSWLRA